jgi:hypothetical protein
MLKSDYLPSSFLVLKNQNTANTTTYPTHNKISCWTDTEQADDNHNKQQDQASPQ